MVVLFSEQARKEFLEFDKSLQERFKKHLEKLLAMPPRRHMRFGVPYHVEDVSKQARLVFEMNNDDLCVIHCFSNHKDYEKWFKSYK